MFEKESEEIVKRNVCVDCNRCQSHGYIGCDIYRYSKDSCLYGLREGYNKANEWHYPSKGEYPKECEDVLCYCRGLGIKFCCVGHPIVGGDDKVRWWANNKIEELRVIAWKEITLPKESD